MIRTFWCLLTLVPAPAVAGDQATLERLAAKVRPGGDVRAAVELAKQGAPAAPLLAKMLDDSDENVRTNAAYALGTMGAQAKAAIPALVQALAVENSAVCSQAAQALGKIGPDAVPALIATLQKPKNPQAVVRAAEALRLLGPVGKAAAPALTAQLTKLPPLLTLPLIDALGTMGPEAKDAVPVLMKLAKEAAAAPLDGPLENHGRAVHLMVALGRIGPAAKEAAPLLVAVLKDKNLRPGDPLQLHALEAVRQIGASPQDLAPMLLEHIKTGKGPQLLYLETLAAIAVPDKDSLPYLQKALGDKNPQIRLFAVRLVGKVDPNDTAVVSVLIESFQEKDAKLRRQAAQLIGELRPRDEAAAETLERVQREDADEGVRNEAKKALTLMKGKK
jgi:HEAT repeat protein